ncbi:MAG: type I methionyl aminopeptidase [Candidatus Magasanikbacteria bacterium RIFOXYC2_FULL_40_16]|uniref:Methionine aminopeptidase n=3 Tax=Candidatus Magasanikiibacteriota TaxID=1752731 RepID=A0A1F6NHB3_9BACT|nr:MAG: type I methionyl aminopeptidase [Candidatus Magasanikbacteria bacterium RIFOXYA2_FULL_40_20]OGH83235.1 MAG: type I methionyl aminopeptidase [Candidatus Magasanikbacteria bacterium RIFOXYB1_FULL_40_15]OGH85167.1 MAG: type I methionyl aminopeptidase [Candidatus Magasanikbacteria bacterium RIFOXYB2_FULL_40_13]OGH87067.1 MAG: type I methionyl aminopeptidase [Candidatus Magasanikbacteria bacterium RIFOXYA1_FULL_40_8]OGH89518.1 MAG: type I methionyl aminopeptidase [Candidatus Magasanikbacteri
MYIKKDEEIKKIIEGGKIIGSILEELSKMVKPGISALEIDIQAEKLIIKAGGKPAFKGYKSHPKDLPFPTTICASLNEEIVHGIATKQKILKEGDIFSIDIGMEWPVGKIQDTNNKKQKGYFTDTAVTVIVGNVPEKVKQLLNVTKNALEIGIEQCQAGNNISDIGKAIENYVKPFGYGIVRDLVGHGVGHAVHEEPRVPNFYDKEVESWRLEPGVVIAIEPMITLGGHEIKTAEDGWSISTADNSLSAHFEHTVIITENGPIVATRRPSEINN